MIELTLEEKDWLRGDDKGTSSIALFSVMTGHYLPQVDEPGNHPWDAADFARCFRLLRKFPSWRDRMGELVTLSPQWAALVCAWDELSDLWIEERRGSRCPRLYRRMCEVLGVRQ